jgi:hypothetical protein
MSEEEILHAGFIKINNLTSYYNELIDSEGEMIKSFTTG